MTVGRRMRRGWAIVLALALAGAATAEPVPMPRPAPEAVDPQAAADLFATPEIAGDIRLALDRAAAGDPAGAAGLLERHVRRHPDLVDLRIALAAIAMLEDDPAAALDHLAAAAATGRGPDAAVLAADPVFGPLADDPILGPRLAALPGPDPAAATVPEPAPVTGGTARVSAANTAWNPADERLEPRFAFPPQPDRPVLADRPKSAAYDLLREHVRRGRAAGNHGDLYDNRDRGHSRLDPDRFPQVTHVAYAPAARAAEVDYGLQDRLLFDHVTFGNSSTAVTDGPFWRSLPRLALTQADGTGPLRLWQNAAANHLYVYPAHRDYGGKRGDLFPANTPYLLISHGASGSDRPFLEAVAMILAAFPPDTKARLIEERLVVPTVQMVFRRSLQNVTSRDLYFSGAAHPAAFEGYDINLARMVSLANAIRPDAIPAEVRIAVENEDLGTEGIDYFGEGLSEQLFDTPGAIGRIWRSRAFRRSMVVSVAASRDPNGRPLEFHWTLLQGDPERVAIEPLGAGDRARITLDWHPPFRISEENPLTASRVDIGVFASNGVHDSAPAIVSWYFPAGETRTWETGPDGGMRIAVIDHADPVAAEAYADPMLVARADWRDDFAYAEDGRPAGWTRQRAGGRVTRFAADGSRLLEPGDSDIAGDGSPATVPVRYPLARGADGRLEVREVDAF